MGIALQKVYDFVWEEFCDWYIEMVKPRLWDDGNKSQAAAIWTLKTVLIESLKLLHPFIPFVTEEIFCNLQDEEESIMVSAWPVSKKEWNFAEEEEAVEMMKEAVRAIRTVRTSMNVPPSKKATVYVVSEDAKVLSGFGRGSGGTSYSNDDGGLGKAFGFILDGRRQRCSSGCRQNHC